MKKYAVTREDYDTKEEWIEDTIKFIKGTLKMTEEFKPELIKFLLSTYDLESWIDSTTMNKYEIASHFQKHARQVYNAAYYF